ncbi:hypothetical protein [Geodermatophilus sp. SYSU D00710]
MLTPYVAQLIADDRATELQRHAATARLAALARCCRPSIWVRAIRRVTAAAVRLRAALPRVRPGAAACCA